MPGRKHSPEQIIRKLRRAEVQLAEGATVEQVCRSLEVTKQTYYRWRKEYGGMEVSQAKRLRQLEKENAKLKRLVAEQALDMLILREAASGN
jgi:putative transposase